jgi:hypothetical protein
MAASVPEEFQPAAHRVEHVETPLAGISAGPPTPRGAAASASAVASTFVAAFDAVFQCMGIRVIKTPVQAPRANAIMERWIGSCRREVLDRILVWDLPHL